MYCRMKFWHSLLPQGVHLQEEFIDYFLDSVVVLGVFITLAGIAFCF